MMINLNSTLGLKILPALFNTTNTQHTIMIEETPLYPQRSPDTNIILIIGENMKYDTFVESKLQEQGHFYKKIFAGATNTDVSVPLLLNTKVNPLNLSPDREPKFDFFLLEDLERIAFEKKNFIVLQQIGEHSPYHYFEGEKSTPKENYKKSVAYSFAFYKEVYKRLQKTQKPFIMIVTSDHGEFSGECGRWRHNDFKKTIYEVPLFIVSNLTLPTNYHDINSHHHLSQFLSYTLGYHDRLTLSENKPIINGTMITREDGYKVID